MRKKVIGVFVGILVGFLVVLLVEGISSMIYPAPEDLSDTEAMKEFVKNLPMGAFLFVLAAHCLGSFLGGMTCAAIVAKLWPTGPLIVGMFFLVAGIVNLVLLPHPLWFVVVDVLVFVPCAILGGKLGRLVFGTFY